MDEKIKKAIYAVGLLFLLHPDTYKTSRKYLVSVDENQTMKSY